MRSVGLALVALLGASSGLAESRSELVGRGELVMLTFPSEVSQFAHPEGDGYAGLDIDIVDGFARKLGIPLRIEVVEVFDDLIPALLDHRGDLIAASFTITAARQRRVDFSRPYFPVVISVVGRAPCALHSEDDYPGMRAAAVEGSSQLERLSGHDVELVLQSSFPANLAAVAEGRADFTLADSTSSLVDLESYPGLEICFDVAEVERYGFAVRPGSQWLDLLDQYVDDLLASGHYYYEMVQTHLGVDGARFFAVTEGPKRRR